MPDTDGNTSSNNASEERRGIERRISALEMQSTALSTSVNEVKTEQKHHSEIVKLSFAGMDARIGTVDRGNDLIVEKLDQLGKVMGEAIGDTTKSPMGRELAKDIAALKKISEDQGVEIVELRREGDELKGAVKFARSINIWSIIVGAGIVIATLIKLFASNGGGGIKIP